MSISGNALEIFRNDEQLDELDELPEVEPQRDDPAPPGFSDDEAAAYRRALVISGWLEA